MIRLKARENNWNQVIQVDIIEIKIVLNFFIRAQVTGRVKVGK